MHALTRQAAQAVLDGSRPTSQPCLGGSLRCACAAALIGDAMIALPCTNCMRVPHLPHAFP